VNSYLADLDKAMRTAHEKARQALREQQRRQKRDYSNRTCEAVYGVGDAVYLANSATKIGQSRKLAPLWKGPLVVTKVLSPVLYQIGSPRKSWTVHHDRLRPCHDDPLPLWVVRKRNSLLGVTDDDAGEADSMEDFLSSFVDEPVYCFCRKPDDGNFMICCDSCQEWYHGVCVNVTQKQAGKIDLYLCQDCKRKGRVFHAWMK
jgi:hypothetical protein